MANSDWGDTLTSIGRGFASAVPFIGPVISSVASSVENAKYNPYGYHNWMQSLAGNLMMSEYQYQHEQQTFDRNLAAQKELIQSQRDYEQEMYDKYSSPEAIRRQKVAAGINPLFSDMQPNQFQGQSSPSPVGGSEMGVASAPSLADFINAGTNKTRALTEMYGTFADVASKAFDMYLKNQANNRDEKRLGNETKDLMARVDEMYSRIDLNDEQRKNIAQKTANLMQENRANDYNLQYLAAVLPEKIERELIQNNLMKSQVETNRQYGALLSAQTDREKFALELDKIAKEHNELALDFDRKTFTDNLRTVRANRRVSETEVDLAKQAYQVGLANVARAALDQLQTERTIDFERLNENILRDLQAEQYSNMAADIKAHVADMILDRSMKLLNGAANAVNSISTVRGNQIRMYNAHTRRAQWGLQPHQVPNSQRSVPLGTYYNPDSSWMQE